MSARRTLAIAFGGTLLVLVAWFVADFSIYRAWLAIGFLLYAAILWRWPVGWLYAVPALLPLFDLAPWSGRFFFGRLAKDDRERRRGEAHTVRRPSSVLRSHA